MEAKQDSRIFVLNWTILYVRLNVINVEDIIFAKKNKFVFVGGWVLWGWEFFAFILYSNWYSLCNFRACFD